MAGLGYTLARGILVGYCLVAFLYTTIYIVATPVTLSVISLFGSKPSGPLSPMMLPKVDSRALRPVLLRGQPRVDVIAHAQRMLRARQQSQANADFEILDPPSWDYESYDDFLSWNSSVAGHPDVFSEDSSITGYMREETFLSKAFSQALRPTELIPFYYKASRPAGKDDVTITTLVTSNRYKVLKELVEKYKGMESTID